MSNLKQMGLAMMQYAQDYDEKFLRTPTISGGFGTWATTLAPYLKSIQILRCPSQARGDGASITYLPRTDYSYHAWYCIGANDEDRAPVEALGSRGTISMATLTRPSVSVIFMDSYTWDARNVINTGNGASDSHCRIDGRCTPAKILTNGNVMERHLGGVNYAFADGHAKWYKSSSPTVSAVVWNAVTPGSMSGNDPTFNPAP